MGQTHGVSATSRVETRDARRIARVMAALGTPSRVLILARLREGPLSVGDLAVAVEMTQPAVSQQLRVLRDLSLVVGIREGRHTIYDLHDTHVATLLDETLRHIDHRGSTDNQQGDAMTDHDHQGPHAHDHDHGEETHSHAHTAHHHEHVEHVHEHTHDGVTHAHPHVHEAGLEDVHAHEHA